MARPSPGRTLEGRVAVVTGAGRGLGRAHALALARHGAAVVVNDLGVSVGGQADDTSPAETVVDQIRDDGGRAVAHFGDCADWQDAEELVRCARDELGSLDILVNNAGIVREAMSFNMTEDNWDSVVRVHLKGHFAPSHHAARYWRERAKSGAAPDGRIVNTTSEAGLFGTTGQVNYVVAKAGIAAMTVALARELGRYGVTVNAISPRAATRMSGAALGMTDDELSQLEDDDHDGFNMQAPANVSPLVCFLAGAAARHITGQTFCVRGGVIQLRKGWRTVAEVTHPGRWTVAELESGLEQLFDQHSAQPDSLEWGRST